MRLFDALNAMRPDPRKLGPQSCAERRALREGRLATRPLPFDTAPPLGRRPMCDAFEHVERENRVGAHKGTEALSADVLAVVRARFPRTLNAADRDLISKIQGALASPHELRQMMRATTEHAHAQAVAAAAVDAS